ncbi:MAG: serine/threonine protein kinase [Gammaproteobacteria bacterium]|nr:serine/threonine protein kinase [Gammaproteobacteria bacterium]
MAVIGSILFNRTLKQFLDCQDLASDKGIDLAKKISQVANVSLDKILATIPKTRGKHREVLEKICVEHAEGSNQEFLLNSLENDSTNIRSTAAGILSQSPNINPSKLFKRLHETDVSKNEIIGILSFQRQFLKPEQIINNALKLEKTYAEKLLDMATYSEQPVELDNLNLDIEMIESPTIKIMLLRYFARLNQAEVARVIGLFLSDKNKTVVIEALKSLKTLTVPFDASVVLPFIETMSEVECEIAIEIITSQADAELVPKLAAWTTTKSDALRETFIKLVAENATKRGLEKFLQRLDQQDWWGKEQALKCLLNQNDARLLESAKALTDHSHELVRNTAQQLAAHQVDSDAIGETALHENWQVREKAIGVIGNSGKRESLAVLRKVIEKWPESAPTVLKAVTKLGFSKGLEIAFACLKMPEAVTQREALRTIAKLTTKQHAENAREMLMRKVPELQTTVKDTAEQVVTQLTEGFALGELKIDDKDFFETKLLRINETQNQDIKNSQETQHKPTAVANFTNIEDLKENDFWMDRYRIKREIGRGAMGRVMLAEDEMVGELLILKFMHPELTADNASRERFLREVKYSRKVSHANVIRIHDMLLKDNLCAISMEYFKSDGIDIKLRQKKYFEAKEGLDILYQVASGMSAAHKQEVIHRDLKPSNILIDDTGLVKVVDFGIASASSNSDSTLTKTGSIIGTPAYLSPERAKGIEADYRCDVYALGIIAYCLFSGQLPYRGEPMSMLFQHLEGNAKPIHEIKKSISPRLSLMVQKMMAVEAENRIQTMDDVCAAIIETQDKL